MSEITTEAVEWLKDANGNEASVAYFGSAEAAQKALDGLIDCKNCINCSRCSGCSGCSDCSGCSGCSGCSDCSHVANLYNKKGLQADTSAAPFTGPPPIPTIANIDAAVLAAASQPEALDMSTWHSCNTTHCRAGWVVNLAGEPGYALERFHDTALAAQLIYRESGSPINPCRFYDDNEEALDDMKKRAEVA